MWAWRLRDALVDLAGRIDERDMVGSHQAMATVAHFAASPKVDAGGG